MSKVYRKPPKRNYTPRTGLALIDGRSPEGKFVRRLQRELIAQIGNPTATERALIQRAVMLSLQVARFDARAAERRGDISSSDWKGYLAWSNSLTRTLAQLGLTPKTSRAKPVRAFEPPDLMALVTPDLDTAASP